MQMSRERRLEGRVAFVTGAASGIGWACAERFAAEGATVVGCDVNTLSEFPFGEFHVVDVRDFARQKEVVDAAAAKYGRIDICVTAAGIAAGGPIHMIAIEDWDRVQDINSKGTFLSCKAVLPHMIKQRSGSIITIASVEGLEGCEGGSTYNASKGAVVLMTKNMACDYGRLNIRVNSICPGFIDTPLLRSVYADAATASVKEATRQQHKLGRFGLAEEIAGVAFFLASDDSSFVTGVALPVDGGYVAGHSYGLGERLAQML